MLWEEFCYVDVKYDWRDANGEVQRAKKWERIETSKLEAWLNEYQEKAAHFCTVQTFKLPAPESREVHYAPFYMDFDMTADLSDSLRDTRLVVESFLKGHEIEPEVWFSGNRGFHLTVDAAFFGAVPDVNLSYHWHHIADKLARKLALKTADMQVYKKRQQWRIENTQHATSGLYKVRLDLSELRKSPVWIREHAKKQREKNIEKGDYEGFRDSLASVYSQAVEEFQDRREEYESSADSADYTFGDDHPACVKYLLNNGLAVLGTKNRADMVLAGYCKDSGMGIDEAIKFMSAWAKGIPLVLTHVAGAQPRQQQSIVVTRTVYSNAEYRFSCGSILACGIEVDCKQCSVRHEDAIELDLWEYSIAKNLGRKVAIEADAIGKDRKELIFPSSVTAHCPGVMMESKVCNQCPMGDYMGKESLRCERTIVFDAKNPVTLELFDATRYTVGQRMKNIFGVHTRCRAFKWEPEWDNAQTIYLASRISSDFHIEDKVRREKIIYFGHALELNQGYKFEGYVWSHPRTMEAVYMADNAEPLQSSLAAFTLERDELQRLAVFQPIDGETPMEKIEAIHNVFINSFAFVFGREDLFLAMDLVYHSVRRMNFQRQLIKGWLDILVLGDTGQAKTKVASELMAYYDLGTMAAGETSSRTGLLYTIQMVAGEEAWVTFGLLPRANGYLVVVDEIHDMKPSDFREFTLVRSKGVVDVKRTAYGVAKAETRLISIANPTLTMRMGTYSYPVEAIIDVPCFKALEDVRRFDFAVGVVSGEVSQELINLDVNTLPDISNPFPGELCKNLILWIWTRKPEEVVIEHDTEDAILELSKRMSSEYIPDIPLVEPADIRLKIVRVAAAIAGRTFSTEDDKHLLVKTVHAEAAYEILNRFYRSDGLQYWGYSDDNTMVSLDAAGLKKITTRVTQYIGWELAIRWILRTKEFTKTRFGLASGIGKSASDDLIELLLGHRLLKESRGGRFIKTQQGRDYFHSLLPPSTKQHLTAAEVLAGMNDIKDEKPIEEEEVIEEDEEEEEEF